MQKSLFPDEEVDLIECPIKMDDLSGMEDAKHGMGALKKEDIIEIAKPFAKTVLEYKYVALDKSGKKYEPTFIRKIRMGNPTKQDWINFLGIFWVEDNFHYYFDNLSEKERNLWFAVADNHYLSVEKASKILGKSCIDKSTWRRELISSLKLTFAKESYSNFYNDHNYIYLSNDSFYRLILKKRLADAPLLDILPKDLLTFNGEKDLFTDLPFIESLYMAKKLKIGKNKLRMVTLKKNLQSLNIREFFEESKQSNEYTTKLRAEYLALIYTLFASPDDGENIQKFQPEDLAKALVHSISQLSEEFYQLFLPYISGVSRNYLRGYYNQYFIENLLTLLATLDSPKWTSVHRLCCQMRLLNLDLPVEEIFTLMDYYEFDRMKLFNECTDKTIEFDEMLAQVSIPALQSILFCLASWGLVEIAYKPVDDKKMVSPFDGLQYVRLTQLGRYAFDIDKQYTPPVEIVKDAKDFELSNDRLLIKLLNPDSPRVLVLSQFATMVTPTLYRVDFKTFLTDCSVRSEVEDKINKFRHIVKEKLPDVWEAFFTQLLKQCEPLSKAGSLFVIRRINADDKKLQEIILTDKELKEYIIRAENYLILIKQKDMDKVASILRKYGYLI